MVCQFNYVGTKNTPKNNINLLYKSNIKISNLLHFYRNPQDEKSRFEYI